MTVTGAPADVYEGLESERVELRDDADELAKKQRRSLMIWAAKHQ